MPSGSRNKDDPGWHSQFTSYLRVIRGHRNHPFGQDRRVVNIRSVPAWSLTQVFAVLR
jgi:hypothetical protein